MLAGARPALPEVVWEWREQERPGGERCEERESPGERYEERGEERGEERESPALSEEWERCGPPGPGASPRLPLN